MTGKILFNFLKKKFYTNPCSDSTNSFTTSLRVEYEYFTTLKIYQRFDAVKSFRV